MRDLFKKAIAGSMIAGAALLVSACGGGEEAEVNNTAMTEMGTDPLMDGTTNDVTAIDAANGMDANMTMDSNLMMNDMVSNDADTNLANGM